MNRFSFLSPDRIRRALRWRFNVIERMSPELLTQQLDAFEAGHLREAVNTWEQIEMRDDLLKAVITKRKKAIARHGWVILPYPGLNENDRAESERHAAALEFFYTHLECSHAVDGNERGGIQLLLRQMMDAIGKRYAVHEIVWKLGPSRSDTLLPRQLTAEFRFVPLTFFEKTTGQLRFLESENAFEGLPLEPGSWMVTTGEGLMMASSVAWMFKHLSVNDWSLYSQRNGIPGVRGISSAVRDSAEWNALGAAVEELIGGGSVVTSVEEDVKVLDFAVGGNIPFPALVERMDRMMAALWRGADLSTISRDRGYGASLQEKESCILEEDDAALLNETLHRQVDHWVIRYLFGDHVKPLARIRVLVSPRECTADDLKIDEFLIRHGVPLPLLATAERYGRRVAVEGEITLKTETAKPENLPSAQIPTQP
ncbi:MAG: DUF935 family protein [Verrucomicrobiota bacterium]|nr:DUF935 family protein [Verrucomicrobiota bacterium]